MSLLVDAMGAPPKYLEAVGRVASSWALFETVIDTTIWSLAEMHHRTGACLTAQIMGAARKLDTVLSLVKLRQDQDAMIKELNAIAKDSQSLAEKRNRVVHDPWVESEGRIVRLETTARKVLRLEQVHVSIPELDTLLVDIDNHMRRYIDAIRPLVPIYSSPETHGPA